MNDTTSSSSFHGTLQHAIGDLFARVTAAPSGTDRARLVRWLLIAAAVFLVWKAWRGLNGLFWAVFGLAWVLLWTRPWHWF